jgi:hypothetical protein
MKHFTIFTVVILQFGLMAEASSSTQYDCQIQQMNFVGGKFVKKTYAEGSVEIGKRDSLIVDMPRTANDPEKMRVILDVGPSLDKKRVHVGFTAIDQQGSSNSSDWDFVFQIESEFELGTPLISLRTANPMNNVTYMAEFSCELTSK